MENESPELRMMEAALKPIVERCFPLIETIAGIGPSSVVSVCICVQADTEIRESFALAIDGAGISKPAYECLKNGIFDAIQQSEKIEQAHRKANSN